MNEPVAELRQLFQIAREGAEFYESAQSDVRDPTLRAVFADMAAAKRELMAVLAADLAEAGAQPPDHGTWIGVLQRLYAQLRLALSTEDLRIYLDRLEPAEDRLLDQLRQTLVATRDPDLRAQLAAFLPQLHDCHDRLRALRQRLAA